MSSYISSPYSTTLYGTSLLLYVLIRFISERARVFKRPPTWSLWPDKFHSQRKRVRFLTFVPWFCVWKRSETLRKTQWTVSFLDLHDNSAKPDRTPSVRGPFALTLPNVPHIWSVIPNRNRPTNGFSGLFALPSLMGKQSTFSCVVVFVGYYWPYVGLG